MEKKEIQLNKYTRDEKKVLNQAFFATLAWTVLMIYFIPSYLMHSSYFLIVLSIIEIILLPILGYLTKKGNKIAVFSLIILFVIPRILTIINNGSNGNWGIVLFSILICIVFCALFYRAYKVIKIRKI